VAVHQLEADRILSWAAGITADASSVYTTLQAPSKAAATANGPMSSKNPPEYGSASILLVSLTVVPRTADHGPIPAYHITDAARQATRTRLGDAPGHGRRVVEEATKYDERRSDTQGPCSGRSQVDLPCSGQQCIPCPEYGNPVHGRVEGERRWRAS